MIKLNNKIQLSFIYIYLKVDFIVFLSILFLSFYLSHNLPSSLLISLISVGGTMVSSTHNSNEKQTRLISPHGGDHDHEILMMMVDHEMMMMVGDEMVVDGGR